MRLRANDLAMYIVAGFPIENEQAAAICNGSRCCRHFDLPKPELPTGLGYRESAFPSPPVHPYTYLHSASPCRARLMACRACKRHSWDSQSPLQPQPTSDGARTPYREPVRPRSRFCSAAYIHIYTCAGQPVWIDGRRSIGLAGCSYQSQSCCLV